MSSSSSSESSSISISSSSSEDMSSHRSGPPPVQSSTSLKSTACRDEENVRLGGVCNVEPTRLQFSKAKPDLKIAFGAFQAICCLNVWLSSDPQHPFLHLCSTLYRIFLLTLPIYSQQAAGARQAAHSRCGLCGCAPCGCTCFVMPKIEPRRSSSTSKPSQKPPSSVNIQHVDMAYHLTGHQLYMDQL
jgi:hypothetical protein